MNLCIHPRVLLKFIFSIQFNQIFELGEFFHLIYNIFCKPGILSSNVAKELIFHGIIAAGLVHIIVNTDFTRGIYKIELL